MKPTKERGRYSRPWHAGAWETCMPFCIVPMYTPLTHTHTQNENNFLPSNKRAAKRNKTFVKKRNTDKFIKQVVDIFSRLRPICAIISGHSCHISSPDNVFSLNRLRAVAADEPILVTLCFLSIVSTWNEISSIYSETVKCVFYSYRIARQPLV